MKETEERQGLVTPADTNIEGRLQSLRDKVVSDEEADQRRAAYESRKHEQRVSELVGTANMPRRHLEMAGVDISAEKPKNVFDRLCSNLGSGITAAMVGPRGPGKTQIGIEWMIHAARNRKSIRYCKAIEFAMAVKRTYRDDAADTEADAIERFARPNVLVIDEIQERMESDWEDKMLTLLIDKRYDQMKDTLIIGNLETSQLQEALGASIMRRCQDTGGVIYADWGRYWER